MKLREVLGKLLTEVGFYKSNIEKKFLSIIDQVNYQKDVFKEFKSDIKIKNQKIIVTITVFDAKIDKEKSALFEQSLKTALKKLSSLEVVVIFASQKKPNQEFKSPNNQSDKSDHGQHSKIDPIKGVKKVIAIASGKGGVGKSTIAVNIAICLKRLGFNVGIVDADIYGPSIPHMMNLATKPEIDDDLMVPVKNYGIDTISLGYLIEPENAAVWRGPMVTKTIYQLIRGVKWNDIDYLIIDLPPGTGDVHLSLAQKFPLDGVVIVSTPGKIAVIDAVKSIDMFLKLEIPIIGIVQNMAYLEDESGAKSYLFGKDGAKEMAEKYGLNFIGEVPIDPKIRESGDNQNPVTNSNPSSNISICFGRIAENIALN